jgi:hypothetical protein
VNQVLSERIREDIQQAHRSYIDDLDVAVSVNDDHPDWQAEDDQPGSLARIAGLLQYQLLCR